MIIIIAHLNYKKIYSFENKLYFKNIFSKILHFKRLSIQTKSFKMQIYVIIILARESNLYSKKEWSLYTKDYPPNATKGGDEVWIIFYLMY